MNWDIKLDHEKLTLALKALGGGLWEYDIDADQVNCNARWYEILGIDGYRSPIRTIRDFHPHIHPDDVQKATEVDLERVAHWLANDEIYHVDFRIIRDGGEIRWLRSVACLIQDAATGHRKAIGCITDVTDLRSVIMPSHPATAAASDEEDADAPIPAHLDSTAPLPQLTEKEKECLRWVSLGKTATESGIILGKSRRTVAFHCNNAVRKLGAANKIHAAAIAIRKSLI